MLQGWKSVCGLRQPVQRGSAAKGLSEGGEGLGRFCGHVVVV